VHEDIHIQLRNVLLLTAESGGTAASANKPRCELTAPVISDIDKVWINRLVARQANPQFFLLDSNQSSRVIEYSRRVDTYAGSRFLLVSPASSESARSPVVRHWPRSPYEIDMMLLTRTTGLGTEYD
jgi:hypothetical protein